MINESKISSLQGRDYREYMRYVIKSFFDINNYPVIISDLIIKLLPYEFNLSDKFINGCISRDIKKPYKILKNYSIIAGDFDITEKGKKLQKLMYTSEEARDTFPKLPNKVTTCICGQKNIQKNIFIGNKKTGDILIIGSECKKKFFSCILICSWCKNARYDDNNDNKYVNKSGIRSLCNTCKQKVKYCISCNILTDCPFDKCVACSKCEFCNKQMTSDEVKSFRKLCSICDKKGYVECDKCKKFNVLHRNKRCDKCNNCDICGIYMKNDQYVICYSCKYNKCEQCDQLVKKPYTICYDCRYETYNDCMYCDNTVKPPYKVCYSCKYRQ